MPFDAGTRLGRYEIRSKLGVGGMGEVYLAQDTTELERTVAIKLLPFDVASDRQRMQRFVQEAKTVSALNHPNILTIYEFGQANAARFIATEYVEGVTLRQHMSGRHLKLHEILDIAMQVAAALDAAHEAGVMHRDIKPENIMIRRRDQIVKVLDFGLAKLIEKVTAAKRQETDSEAGTQILVQTEPGLVMGTVSYMSPEQARGLGVDARTDIWSLGVILYEMIAGCLPFAGETTSDVIAAILKTEPPLLNRYVPDVPAELERIVTKALRKEKEERYQVVKDLALDLKTLKRRLEFEAELVRTGTPEKSGEARRAATSGGHSVDGTTQVAAARTDGVGGASDVHTTSSAEYIVGKIKRHMHGALVVLATFVVATATVAYFAYSRYFAASGKADIRSIAVLPFTNTSNDPDTEYLSDGLSESLINSLSQLSQLKVIARSSTFQFKGKEIDPQEVAKVLGVQAIVSGRIVERGDNLQISVEMVDARDKTQIWGEQYNRKLTDLVALQQEISRDVSQKLQVRLSGADEQRLAKSYTENPQAYQHYLKGRYQLNKKTEDSFKRGIGFFQQAIEQDPNYALAYAGLADAYNEMGMWTTLPPSESFPRAKAAAERALHLDSTLAEAHTALAFEMFQHEWDFAAAERACQQAINLNPRYAPARELHAYQMYLANPRRFNEAMQELKIAYELDPLSLSVNFQMAALLYFERQYDKAADKLRELQNLEPSFTLGYGLLGAIYTKKGMNDEAVAAVLQESSLEGGGKSQGEIEAQKRAYRESGIKGFWRKDVELMEERAKARYVSPIFVAMAAASLDDTELAFEWLDKAYAERSSWLVEIGVDPVWDNLRSDPRFQDLMRRVGLPQ